MVLSVKLIVHFFFFFFVPCIYQRLKITLLQALVKVHYNHQAKQGLFRTTV